MGQNEVLCLGWQQTNMLSILNTYQIKCLIIMHNVIYFQKVCGGYKNYNMIIWWVYSKACRHIENNKIVFHPIFYIGSEYNLQWEKLEIPRDSIPMFGSKKTLAKNLNIIIFQTYMHIYAP
jgi:hypothetical protein